ncbi:LpqB family beta-propeller domain-containing protein [Brachybacterium squillarum]|uniref:LpqB family beta-propeller domain-containing protein n=1 Tax=Brachybacterium squillarum TaxID=661979 RepID=UPI0002629B9B|nr:LpqB family beta-propeller domain-containing protein [Brachybacterium squillarum]
MTAPRPDRPGRHDPAVRPALPGRRRVLGLGAAALLGLGTGCARIPTSTDIEVRPVGEGVSGGAPYVRAVPPEDGASAVEVVRGFVQAGVGAADDYAVAREFLTPSARESWDPSSGVTIYSGTQELEIQQAGSATVTLALRSVAALDSAGVRSVLAGPANRQFSLELEQVEERWRIASLPDGIFLSEAAFEALFAPGQLYFVDPRARHLVPDHRWFLLQDAAGEVLDRLDAGPSPVLGEAVTSAVPAESGIGLARLGTAADGTPEITVPGVIGALPAAARARALAQMESSLRSVRTLSSTQLVWAGADMTPTDEPPLERALPVHRPIAAGARGVVSLDEGTAGGAGTQLVPALEDMTVRAPAIAKDGVLAAALREDGNAVLIASADGSVPRREAVTGAGFVPPRVDDAGYVWTSVPGGSGLLVALRGDGAGDDVLIDAAWLEGRELRALDLAADSTRMLVLSTQDDTTRLDLCAVVRDAEGVPTALTEPRVLRVPGMEDLAQAGWYDDQAVLVLGVQTADEQVRAQVVDLAAGVDTLPGFDGPVERIAGTAVADAVWAGDGAGTLWRSDGESWRELDLEATDPALY